MATNIIGKGAQGPQGYQGATGAQGDTGVQGAQGYQGDIGPQGSVGAQGPQGYQGDIGNQGPQGYQGDSGAQGSQGSQGAQGAQGPQGADGERTSTGSSVSFLDIDWSLDDTFYKGLSGDATFTFSNSVNGNVISIAVICDSSNRNVTWPSGIKWPSATAVTSITANTTTIFTFIQLNSVIYATAVEGLA